MLGAHCWAPILGAYVLGRRQKKNALSHTQLVSRLPPDFFYVCHLHVDSSLGVLESDLSKIDIKPRSWDRRSHSQLQNKLSWTLAERAQLVARKGRFIRLIFIPRPHNDLFGKVAHALHLQLGPTFLRAVTVTGHSAMTEPCTPPSAVRTRYDEPPGTLFKLQRRREALEFQGDRIDRILRMHDRKKGELRHDSSCLLQHAWRAVLVTRRVRCPRWNQFNPKRSRHYDSALTTMPRGAQGLPLHQKIHHKALPTAAAAPIAPAVAGATSAAADPFELPDEVLAAMQLPERTASAATAAPPPTPQQAAACLIWAARRPRKLHVSLRLRAARLAQSIRHTDPPLQCQGLYLECM